MIGLGFQVQNKPIISSPALVDEFIILESGGYIFTENNDYLILE